MKRPSVRTLLFGCLLPSLVLAATPSTPPPVTQGVMTYYWDGTKSVAVTAGNPLPVTGGGGGGGSVTQGTIPWVVSGQGTAGSAATGVVTVQGIASGTALGISATSLPLPTGAATSANQTTEIGSLATIATNTGASVPAGAAVIGKVGIDQTTPGTTNGVQTLTGSTTAVTQATASSLNATVVGAGTAGTANANPVTVQGIAGMTKLLVTPDSVALPANQSVNLAQINGTSTASLMVPASTAPVTATNPALTVDLRPDSPGIIALGPATIANSVPVIPSSQYPGNATAAAVPVTATATGTTAATVATIPAVAGKTAYVCGFTITSDATALAVGTAVVSGTISGSLSYLQGISAVTSGAGNLTQSFNPCIPASAANTAIVVTSAAAGTGGNTIVNAQGYYL